jgi:endonuclease V-like protein UPF0215 family
MPQRRLSHVIGVDDAPFERDHRGDVLVVGVAFAGTRIDGVVSARARRDVVNSTLAVAAMIQGSQFFAHLHAVLFQGIALAGFNVIDIHGLSQRLGKAVLVVARKQPDLAAIRRALLTHVRGGAAKWKLIERAGPMEPAGPLFVQRAGLDLAEATALLERLSLCGHVPEPLRIAHLIAGGVTTGKSRGRA